MRILDIDFRKILVLTIVFGFILSGCVSEPKEVAPEPPQTEVVSPPLVESDPPETETVEEPSDNSLENPEVFDFADLSEEDFPRGMWTVNQLISKYGTPEQISAHGLFGSLEEEYNIVYVYVSFEGFDVYFNFSRADRFSFYNVGIENGDYNLSENDKDLELEILDIHCRDENISFLNDFKIGQTTKSQVLEAYPTGSALTSGTTDSEGESSIDYLMYNYGFRNENGGLPKGESGIESGYVVYSFDERDVLELFTIRWLPFSI